MKQKGPIVLNAESVLPPDRDTLFNLLKGLHQRTQDVADLLLPIFKNSVLVDHLREHWFGYRLIESSWEAQPQFKGTYSDGFGPVFETGHWINYYGDVESVVRVALIRVIERILELDPIDYPRDPAASPLITDSEFRTAYKIALSENLKNPHGRTLEIWWICPQTRFEAFIETDSDTVRLEFFTPAPEGGVLGSGYRGTDPAPFQAASQVKPPQTVGEVFQLVGADGPLSSGGLAQPSAVNTALAAESWLVGQDKILLADGFQWLTMPGQPFVFLDPFTRFVGDGYPATIDVRTLFGGKD